MGTRFVAIIFTVLVSSLGLVGCDSRHDLTNQQKLRRKGLPLKPTFAAVFDNIIIDKCLECHSPGGKSEKFPLTSWKEILDSPLELVIPGNPEESGLYIAVTRTDEKRMPSKGAPLSSEELKAIYDWIKDGAKGPEKAAAERLLTSMTCRRTS